MSDSFGRREDLNDDDDDDDRGHATDLPRGPPPADGRSPRALKLRVGQFNLLNFHAANVPFYQYKYGLSPAQVEAKIAWTASQLKLMNAAVVGFQEIFSLEPLIEAAKRAGYDMSKTTIVSPSADGKSPAVGLLSVYPIVDVTVFHKFPENAILDLAGDDDTTPAVILPVNSFSRPVLRAVVEIPTGHRVAFYVTHLKSKRPLISKGGDRKNGKDTAMGMAVSLIIRSAEAAALRCILLDELLGTREKEKAEVDHDDREEDFDDIDVKIRKSRSHSSSVRPHGFAMSPPRTSAGDRSRSRTKGTSSAPKRPVDAASVGGDAMPYHTTIVMGDLNDVTHAVSTEIISGTVPFKKLPYWEKEYQWRTLLYSTHDVQVRRSERDVNYTYIHNGRYECLDNILVSNDLVRGNPDHIGYVQWLQCFNDHLIDSTLAENDDDYDSPLTLPPAPPSPRIPAKAAAGSSAGSVPVSPAAAHSSAAESPQHRANRLKGKDVSKSDHGQMVALIKIFPKGFVAAREYDEERLAMDRRDP